MSLPKSSVVLDSFHDFDFFIVSHTWIYLLLVLVWLFKFETAEMIFKKSNGSHVDHQDNISYLNDVNELNVNDPNLIGGFGDTLLPPIERNTLLYITIIIMLLLQLNLFFWWVCSWGSTWTNSKLCWCLLAILLQGISKKSVRLRFFPFRIIVQVVAVISKRRYHFIGRTFDRI